MDKPEFPVTLEVKSYEEYQVLKAAINQWIYHKEKFIEKGETEVNSCWKGKVPEWKAEVATLKELQHRLWRLWDLYN